MSSSKISGKNNNTYDLFYKYLINENRVFNKVYNGNCSIDTKFFVDVVIDNYYHGYSVKEVDEFYLKKSNKWYGSSTHNYNISWIKNLFKLNKSTKTLSKNISSNFTKEKFKLFLIEHMTTIINNHAFESRSKVLLEWTEYLRTININNNILCVDLNDENELEKIKKNDNLSTTEKEALYKARIGQGKYREDLLKLYDKTCVLSGIKAPELLIASHIVPWREGTNEERLDKHNGLLLSATIDKLFDQYFISFDEEGIMVISDSFKNKHHNYEDIMLTIGVYESFVKKDKAIKLSHQTKEYMKKHYEKLKN